MEDNKKTKFNDNGCPVDCPCLDDYPNCYCMEIIDGDNQKESKQEKVLPILFNTEMVRAILDGRKTVTRRICKDGNEYTEPDMGYYDADKRTYAVHNYANTGHTEKLSIAERKCPICPGDILYVRETWMHGGCAICEVYECYGSCGASKYLYKADYGDKDLNSFKDDGYGWKPSLHMPKEAARIFLKIKDVRVERLRDMNEVDTAKEGIRTDIQTHRLDDPDFIENFGGIDKFKELWNSTIKKADLDKYGWNANPWVWVIEFERCEKPEQW